MPAGIAGSVVGFRCLAPIGGIEVQPGQIETVIGCDNAQGGHDATAHLIEMGRERIAFIGTATTACPEFLDRHRGYCRALDAAGLPHLLTLQVDALSTEADGQDAGRRLIARGEPFDAVVCASDLIAIGAIRALSEAGLRVPDDVAVTGFDDILAAGFYNPPLTTVAQEPAEAGILIVDTLLRLIRNQPVQSTMLPARLVVRKSSGAN